MFEDVRKNLAGYDANSLVIAYSGGLDSHVLLKLAAESCPGVSAIHINHGLSPHALAWQEHCESVCADLEINLDVYRVRVATEGSLEANARTARYEIFGAALKPGQTLLLAHHLDDQVETALFHLMRGDAPLGIMGMPETRPLGAGQLARPLLASTREQVLKFATSVGLKWIEDESNSSLEHDRNFLRHEVIPLLKSRWPGVEHRVLDAVGRASDGMQLLDALAENDLAACLDGPYILNENQLFKLPQNRQLAALKLWFQGLTGGLLPPQKMLVDYLDSMVSSAKDRAPLLNWQGWVVQSYRGTLYAIRECYEIDKPIPFRGEALVLGECEVSAEPAKGIGVRFELGRHYEFRPRIGGEKIRLGVNKDLKTVFQEISLPPALRGAIPLLFCEDELVACPGVPQLGVEMVVAQAHKAVKDEPGINLKWQF